MATEKRTYPNDNFAWYNDDNRIAIVTEDASVSGDRTTERYDTFQGSGSTGSITAFADYGTTVTGTVLATSAEHGLLTDDSITISGTTNFEGTFSVTKKDKDSFYFTDTWVSLTDESGEWTGSNVFSGLRITFHSKYEEMTTLSQNLTTQAGLDSALHNAVLCYVKSRLYEDANNIQQAQYFMQMYEKKVKKHRGRRSGVRNLALPRL